MVRFMFNSWRLDCYTISTMTNNRVAEYETAFRAVGLLGAELDYIKFLVAKSSAELERGHRNEAHEALFAARRTYDVLRGQVAVFSEGRAHERQYLKLHLRLADLSMIRSERRLAAHARTDEVSTSSGAYLAKMGHQCSTQAGEPEAHGPNADREN